MIYDGKTFNVYPLDEGVFESEYLLDDGVSPISEDNREIVGFKIECDEKEIRIRASKGVPIKVVDIRGRKITIS